MKTACSALMSLKSQQDEERNEYRRYNYKARDEVMRLRRQAAETNQQLSSVKQNVSYYDIKKNLHPADSDPCTLTKSN